MRYEIMSSSDEIKSKLDIVEIIREYIPLKAAGYNFRAACPFHREKTPSFMVSPEKQIWHCFGCGKGGDVFSFVMEIEGLNFIEALRHLAKKAGVVLKKTDPALSSKRNVLLNIVESAVKFYHKILLDGPAAEAGRRYLKERALSEETIGKWQIGYSQEGWSHLINFLKSKGFSDNDIFLSGLSVKKDAATASGRAGFYDRFRGRIMFPINDINSNPVGFSARLLPLSQTGAARSDSEAREKMGKYINTPATMIYDKSRILFGLDKAKMAIKSEDAAVLVEGQMDCVTAHQAGFNNVIASSGTALTEHQVSLIKRYTNNLYLSFDMDQAGDLASERGIREAMAAEMQIKVIEIKEGKDPDECIKKNPDHWREAVKLAKPMMRYYFDKTFAKFNKSDYEGQRRIFQVLLPVIAKFGSKIEQDFWLKKLSQEADAKEELLREKLTVILTEEKDRPKIKAEATEEKKKSGLSAEPADRADKLSELLMALALKYPANFEYIINHLAIDELAGSSGPANGKNDYKLLYKNLIIYYNKLIDYWTLEGGSFDLSLNYHNLKEWFNNPENLIAGEGDNHLVQAESLKCSNLMDKLILLADKDFYDYSDEQAKAEIMGLIASLKINYLAKRRREIVKLIGQAEKENLPPEEKAEKLNGLMREHKALNEEIKSYQPH